MVHISIKCNVVNCGTRIAKIKEKELNGEGGTVVQRLLHVNLNDDKASLAG